MNMAYYGKSNVILFLYFLQVIILTYCHSSANSGVPSVSSIENVYSSNSIRDSNIHSSNNRQSTTTSSGSSLSSSSKKKDQQSFIPIDMNTKFIAECELPSIYGNFNMRSYIYKSATLELEPIVIINGDISNKENVLVRVHDQCFTSEVLGSLRCDCREQLQEALHIIREEDGIVIYLQQEGRGIGLPNKIAAYAIQDVLGLDTVDANLHLGFEDELRQYDPVPDILKNLNVKSIRLLTNNPFKVDRLSELGIKITERIPINIPAGKYNRKYLSTKRDRMDHLLDDHSLNLESLSGSEDLVNNKNKNKRSNNLSLRPRSRTVTNTNNHNNNNHNHDHNKNKNKKNTKRNYLFGKQSVIDAIAAVKNGEIVCVVDDEDRENEGDLIMAAEKATPETIGFIVRYTSGVLCVSLEDDRLNELNLPPMYANNEDPKETAYAISCDAKEGTTTGISAADRAITFRQLVDTKYGPDAFTRPGHVFPLRYKEGGVLNRWGHTEAALDLSRLAGLKPGGVLAEVVNDDGSCMRLESPNGGLKSFAKQHKLVLTSVHDIIAYREESER